MNLRSQLAGKSVYLLMSITVLVLDQWTKWLVEARLPIATSVPFLPSCLSFTHVKNTGIAFGLFAARGSAMNTWILILLGLVALGIVSVYFLRTPRDERWLLASLGLILGGAVGNLLDRTVNGSVTDFIDFFVGNYHWHTFNVADSAITVGILLMAVDILRPRRQEAIDGEAA